jgi:hypothetical protein
MELKLYSLVRLQVTVLQTLLSKVNFTKVNYKYFVPAFKINTLHLHTKEPSLNSV